jgi:hypothetical protein
LELLFHSLKQNLVSHNHQNTQSRLSNIEKLKYSIVGEFVKKLLKKLNHNNLFTDFSLMLKLLKSLVPLAETFDSFNNIYHFSSHSTQKLPAPVYVF